VTAVSGADATPAMGLEVREAVPIETKRHEDTVHFPETTVPPTVVSSRPQKAEAVARAQCSEWNLARAVTNQCR